MNIDRRTTLKHGVAATGLATIPFFAQAVRNSAAADVPETIHKGSAQLTNKIRYCLNTSTIQGEKVPVQEQVKIAAKAGYDGIELWVRDVDRYLKEGGQIGDLRKQIADQGLTVESSIAFGSWIVDDDKARKEGLAQCGRDMEIIRELGGRRIAAPPSGATEQAGLNLDRAAERYRALLEVGRARDVSAQLEVWGFSKNLYRLSQVLYICAAAEHPNACILPDIYHLYKGGSNFADVHLLPGSRVHVFHMNDYPENPDRTNIGDQHRVYPGDGVAPIEYTLRAIIANGFQGVLSLELFNRDYWQQDPNEVAKTGLAKMKASVSKLGVPVSLG